MKRTSKNHLLSLALTGLLALPSFAQTQLANPSFEEDAGNVGNPDGWGRDANAKVKVVGGHASKDNRALHVMDGYIVANQDLNIPLMAGQTLRFSIDAKGESDDAVMGVRIGFLNEDGQWLDVPLLWERKLTKEYQTIQLTTPLPPTARAGRLYLGIYRNNGTFFLDNADLRVYGGLPDTHAHRAITLARDATYVLNRIKAAGDDLPTPQKATWTTRTEAIVEEARYAKTELIGKFDEYERTVTELNAQIFEALGKGKSVMTNWAPPFVRLAPDALPSTFPVVSPHILSLRGEHQAFGLDVANTGPLPSELALEVEGIPAACELTWRRQVFTETWYERGESLLADPLTRLATKNGAALFALAPGEITRLYADISVPGTTPPGTYNVKVHLLQKDRIAVTKTLKIEVSAKAVPPRRMAHYAFAYLITPVVANHTAEAVQDLVAHGVTDIEWANRPPAKYDENGNLLSVDWSFYDNMLRHFGPTQIRLNTFWPYPPELPSGEQMTRLSPAWKNALSQLLSAWIQHAEEKGVTPDRITLLIQDEIHSSSLEKAPEPEIQQYLEMVKFFKEKFPEIKNYLTLTYFAFAPDAKAVIPVTDVMMPYLPMPESLPFNAPPSYNPRLAFAADVDPALVAERDKRGMQLWSYHVSPGRSSSEFWNRAYALAAAATGYTGIGFWAYDVTLGKTWDDTDGGLLDYNFVYDGTEDHPLATKWNVTREGVVPSIRWEAVRAGLQDADIFLALRATAAETKLTEQQRKTLENLFADAEKKFLPSGILAPELTPESLDGYMQRARELYNTLP
jgi:hypothetical protein